MSKYEVISGPYFPVFGTVITPVFGHFSRSVSIENFSKNFFCRTHGNACFYKIFDCFLPMLHFYTLIKCLLQILLLILKFLVPIPDQVRKLTEFIFMLLCVALKGFMKTLKPFITPFETPQKIWKEKFEIFFILIQLSNMHGTRRVKQIWVNVFLFPLKSSKAHSLFTDFRG